VIRQWAKVGGGRKGVVGAVQIFPRLEPGPDLGIIRPADEAGFLRPRERRRPTRSTSRPVGCRRSSTCDIPGIVLLHTRRSLEHTSQGKAAGAFYTYPSEGGERAREPPDRRRTAPTTSWQRTRPMGAGSCFPRAAKTNRETFPVLTTSAVHVGRAESFGLFENRSTAEACPCAARARSRRERGREPQFFIG